MRGKNTRCKKIRKVVAYTVLGITALGLSNYAESYSVYRTSNEREPLAYEATIHPRYKGTFDITLLGKYDETGPYSSDYKNAFFQFTFPRNNFVNNDVKDTYSIVIPSDCSILSGVFTNVPEVSKDKKQITYKKKGNEETKLFMYCPVEKITTKVDGKDTLKVDVTIEETIGEGKEQIHIDRYKDGSFVRDLSLYYQSYPTPDMGVKWTDTYLQIPKSLSSQFFSQLKNNSLISDLQKYLINFDYDSTLGSYDFNTMSTEEQLYIIFEKIWLENIICKYNTSDCEAIKKYVTSSYPNSQSIINDKKLPGFKVTVNSNDYRYELVDNFLGYARTANDNQNMYFSTDKDEILDQAFDYYLKTYSYSENSTLLKEYVESFNTENKGISYILANGTFSSSKITLNNGQNVYGMIYDKANQKLSFAPEILVYANSKVNQKIQIDVNAYSDRLSNVLAGCLEYAYGDIISSKSLDSIRTDTNNVIVQAMKKNATDYLVWYDETNKSYLYFTIQPSESTTLVEVNKLISETKNGMITFNLSDTNQDKLLHIVQALDVYFKVATSTKPIHTSLGNDTYITTTSNGNVTNVKYQIPENCIVIPFGTEEEMLATFKNGLEEQYKGLLSYSSLDKDALAAVIKNNSNVGTKDAYSQYFAYEENGKYQLLTIYSDKANTYAIVREIDSTLNNNIIDIKLHDTDENKLLAIVQSLDYLFNVVDTREEEKQFHKTLTTDGTELTNTKGITYYITVSKTSDGIDVRYSIPDKKITVPFGSSEEMINTFIAGLEKDYADIVSEPLREGLKNTKDSIVIQTLIWNCSSAEDNLCYGSTDKMLRTVRSHDDVYNHNVLFEVYTDGINAYVVVSVDSSSSTSATNSLSNTNSVENISVDGQAIEKEMSISEDKESMLDAKVESSVNNDFTTSTEETQEEVSLQESKNKLITDEESDDEKDVSMDTSDEVSVGSADAPLDNGVDDAPSETVHQSIESIDKTVNEILPVESG